MLLHICTWDKPHAHIEDTMQRERGEESTYDTSAFAVEQFRHLQGLITRGKLKLTRAKSAWHRHAHLQRSNGKRVTLSHWSHVHCKRFIEKVNRSIYLCRTLFSISLAGRNKQVHTCWLWHNQPRDHLFSVAEKWQRHSYVILTQVDTE